MALITNTAQGCHSCLSPRPQLWRNEPKVKTLVSFQLTKRTHKHASSKYGHQWSRRPVISQKSRVFKVSSFKGNSQNEADSKDARFKSSKNSIQLSLSQQEREEIVAESRSPDVKEMPASVDSEGNESTLPGSPAIKNLFRKWLALLRSQPSSVAIDEPHPEKLKMSVSVEVPAKVNGDQKGNFLKAVILYFWALDATIKLPLVIFPPFYLVIRVAYGIAVARELTPLWVLGPLILAFYVAWVKWIFSLYVLCFKLTKKFIFSLPIWYRFVREGKLRAYLLHPIVVLKNMSLKEFSKQLMEWANEKRLDFVESIWPFYCRTVRILKRANLL